MWIKFYTLLYFSVKKKKKTDYWNSLKIQLNFTELSPKFGHYCRVCQNLEMSLKFGKISLKFTSMGSFLDKISVSNYLKFTDKFFISLSLISPYVEIQISSFVCLFHHSPTPPHLRKTDKKGIWQ